MALTRVTAKLVTFIQGLTGATSRVLADKLADSVGVKDFGAVGNGVADDRAAFLLAVAATAGAELTVPRGTYRFAANTTLTAHLVMQPGAILRPAAGVKIILTAGVTASPVQCFDRSAGGAIEFSGAGIPEVFVEWWGANATRNDNNIPIQHAIDAVQSLIYADFTTTAPNADNSGGVVRFGYAQDYRCTGRIHTRNNVLLKGKGQFTRLMAYAVGWGAHTELWLSANGVVSQYGCRAEDMTFNAGGIVGVRAIYAPAWQQSCGLRDVYIQNFFAVGLQFDNGYGGSVGFSLVNVDFTPAVGASAGVKCIAASVPYTAGWLNVILDNVQFGSGFESMVGIADQVGIEATGRIRVLARALHSEGTAYAVALYGAAGLYGDGIAAGGNPSTKAVVLCDAAWTGRIDVAGLDIGGAQKLVWSFAASPTHLYRDVAPIFGRVMYPHTPSEVMASARNTSNAGTLESTAFGFASITRTGAGAYTLTFSAAFSSPSGGTAFRTRVEPGSVAGRTCYVVTQTATTVLLQFLDLGGAAADCGLFDVYVSGRPGL